MPHDKDPKFKKFEWKGGTRTPEETRALNVEVLRQRGLAYPGKQQRENQLEDLDPQIIELARIKAEQIAMRASDIEQISALAHIDKVIADKTPSQMIDALNHVILAAAGKFQLASEIELALAFLAITDNKPNETQ